MEHQINTREMGWGTLHEMSINGQTFATLTIDRGLKFGGPVAPSFAVGLLALAAIADGYSKMKELDSKYQNGLQAEACNPLISKENLAEWTGLEPATPGVTGPGAK